MFCHFLIDCRSHVGDVDWKGKLRSQRSHFGKKKQSEVHSGTEINLSKKKKKKIG